MTLSHLYQKPLCLEPLDADPDKNGQKSDHMIVISKPISVVNNKSARLTRTVKVRPFPQSGILKLREKVYRAETAHEKAELFQKMLATKLDEIFPEKKYRVMTNPRSHLNSRKWTELEKEFIERKEDHQDGRS
jgi:hypothetical protein